MKYINRRGQGFEINKLLVVTLVILTIVLVIFLLFRADITQYLKTLPGYSYDETDKVIDIEKLDPEAAKNLCPERIGSMRVVTNSGTDKQFIFFGDQKSNYYVGGNPAVSAIINYDRLDWSFYGDDLFNSKKGDINKGVVSIQKKGENSLLDSLDGSFFLGNIICKGSK